MEITSTQNIEQLAPMSEILRDYLLSIEWGTENYPVELLALNDKEQRILRQVEGGMSLAEISRTSGITYDVAIARHYVAKGKRDAQMSLDSDVLSLSPQAQQVVVLNGLFGATWNRGSIVLVGARPEVILANVPKLDEDFGDKWKRCPELSVKLNETVKDRTRHYDEVLHRNWRNKPVILTLSSQVVEERRAIYDKWFGKYWQKRPSILTNTPRTVISSVRALKTIGITQENTAPGLYFNLLTTTVANKRKKTIAIRRDILGHEQVRVHEVKKPKLEIVRDRQNQSQEDKATEAREMEEFGVFLRRLGASGLVRSIGYIKDWANSHGYSPASNIDETAYEDLAA